MKKCPLWMLLFIAAVATAGCGSGSGPGGTPSPTPPVTPGNMYASNGVTSTILRFGAGASGNTGPSGQITGAATQLQTPAALLADGVNDRLFVSDPSTASILVFEHVSTKSGNIAPDRTITGANTALSSPGHMALDAARDELYVTEEFNNAVLVFAPASTATGNIVPARSLALGFSPRTILLDSPNNRLFVADMSRVMVYDNASTLALNAIANRVIAGAATQLLFPAAMQLDGNGRLLVLNSSISFNGITIYANAASANGNIAPTAVITGPSTQFSAPITMAVSSTGELFVADQGAAAVLVFDANASGNASPVRSLAGSNTLLQTVPGIGNFRGFTIDHPR